MSTLYLLRTASGKGLAAPSCGHNVQLKYSINIFRVSTCIEREFSTQRPRWQQEFQLRNMDWSPLTANQLIINQLISGDSAWGAKGEYYTRLVHPQNPVVLQLQPMYAPSWIIKTTIKYNMKENTNGRRKETVDTISWILKRRTNQADPKKQV